MDSGLVTVLVALIGALSTLAGVIYTQRSSASRERAHLRDVWENQQQHEARRALRERDEALLDRRIEAHSRFLSASVAILDVLPESLGGTSGDVLDRVTKAAEQVYEALTGVRLFGSSGAVDAAERVMNGALSYQQSASRSEWWESLHEAVALYRVEMRRDLGVR